MNKKASFIIPTVIIKASSELDNKRAIQSLLHEQESPNFLEEMLLMPNVRRDAGRLSGLAEAAGTNQNLTVSNPVTSRVLSSLLGSGIGGGIALGLSRGKLRNSSGLDSLGAAIGGLSGYGYDTAKSIGDRAQLRNELSLKNIQGNKFEKDIKPGNILASLISGMHQKGKTDAFEAITQGKTKFEGNKLQSLLEGIQAGTFGATAPFTMPGAMVLSIKDFMDANKARAKS